MLLIAWHQQIIGREADLACVHHLAQRDPLARLFLIRTASNDGRRLAAKFQRDRHQIVGGSAHDMFANARRTREDHMVKGQFRKGHADLSVAGENRHFLLSEIFGHNFFKQGRHPLGKFGWLDHGAVTGGKNTRHGHHHHANREVPRRDDADHTLGLEHDLGLGTDQAQRKGGLTLFALGPAFKMLLGVLHRADRRHDIGQQRLFAAAMAEIRRNGLCKIFGMVDQQRNRAVNTVAAHRHRFRHGDGKRGALFFEHSLHICGQFLSPFNQLMNC